MNNKSFRKEIYAPLMTTFTIFKYELQSSIRTFEERISKHFVFSFLFATLFTLIAIFGAGVIISILKQGIMVDIGTILLLFLTLIIARSVEFSQRALLRSATLDNFLSLPIKTKPIVLAKFLVNLIQVLSIIFAGLLIVFVIITFTGFFILTVEILIEIILIVLLGTFLGFTTPIIVYQKPMSLKVKTITAFSPLFLASYILFTQTTAFTPFHIFILLILTFISAIAFYFCDELLLNAITISYKKEEETEERLTFLDKLPLDKKVITIAKKELITLIREKEALGTILASAFLIAVPIFSHFFIKIDFKQYQYLSMPFILAVCLFLSAILQNTMLGLAIISIEGKRLWILKSLPIKSKIVIRGKTLALVLLSLPTMLTMALLYPIIANYKPTTIFFFFVIAIILILSFTGIGVLLGSLIPNFDESVKGMPDFTAQFISSFICMVLAGLMIGIPSYILIVNYNFGLIAILISLLWAFIIYIFGIQIASNLYKKIDIEDYG